MSPKSWRILHLAQNSLNELMVAFLCAVILPGADGWLEL
jgi:hypothetical protein